MRFLVFPVLMMILVYCFSGCGADLGSSDETKKRKYKYDQASLTCLKNGEPGTNKGKITECGFVADKDLSGQDFSKMNLRGMIFSNCNLEGASFNGANLFGAAFVRSNLNRIDLRNANATSVFKDSEMNSAKLQGAAFIGFKDTDTRISATLENTSLSDSIIDSRTVIDMTLTKALESGLIYEGADKVQAEIGRVGTVDVSIRVAVEDVVGVSGGEPLTVEEFARFRDDLNRFTKLKLKSGNKWYEKIFGDSRTDSLIKFVDDRVNYIFSKTDENHPSNDELTLASNYGPNYWNIVYNDRLDELNGGEKDVKSLIIDEEVIKIDHPRVGVVSLGPAYVHLEDGQLRRNGTLVHEARHSDCPEDPSNEDLVRYLDDNELPKGSLCNFPHAKCPSGSLEGLAACDSVAWGSYAVGAIFYEKIARDCENCTELERQMAMLAEKDAKSRVLVLEDMLDGKLGNPNMKSK